MSLNSREIRRLKIKCFSQCCLWRCCCCRCCVNWFCYLDRERLPPVSTICSVAAKCLKKTFKRDYFS